MSYAYRIVLESRPAVGSQPGYSFYIPQRWCLFAWSNYGGEYGGRLVFSTEADARTFLDGRMQVDTKPTITVLPHPAPNPQ